MTLPAPSIVSLATPDGHRFDLTCYGNPHDPTLLFFPAMGVSASYYKGFAGELAQSGIHTVIGELRGLGTSSIRASRANDYGFHEILTQDFPTAMAWVRSNVSGRVFTGGHSLGGQLAVLSSHTLGADGLVLVASCLPYRRGWAGSASVKMYGGSYLIDALGSVRGYYPGDRLGFGGRDGRSLMSDWAHCVRHGNYSKIRNADRDWEAQIEPYAGPILALGIDGDDWSPYEAIDMLVRKAPNADSRLEFVGVDSARHPHFAWAKDPARVVERISGFMR